MRLPNLLPTEHKKEYRLYLGLLYTKRFLLVQMSVLIVLGFILGGQYLYYKNTLESLHKEAVVLGQLQKEIDIKSIQEAADRHNERLKAATAILNIRPELSPIIDELLVILPLNVTLDQIKLDALLGRIEVLGRAKDRQQVIDFQNKIELSKVLNPIYVPLSNLTESKDTPFRFILSFNVPKSINNQK